METLKKYLRRYFIDAMGAMALGLFASLLIGTIFKTLGTYTKLEFLTQINTYAAGASGMAIGCAIAYALKAHPLVIFSCAAVGSMGYSMGATIALATGDTIAYTAGPAGAFFAAIVAAEIGMLVSKKTKVDILVTPIVTLLSGFAVSALLCPGIAYVMYYLGYFVNTATEMQPLLMGIVIAVVVGMILTLPISSAAICAMIGISGIAGGAAAVGCCCQMVGFAVISFRENRFGGLVAQGLGTSMLQMGNICRKPQIWIAPTLASAVCGPLSTMLFRLKCVGVSAGMGTCGLVGPIGIISATENSTMKWIGLILLCIVFPAVLSFLFNEILRKIGWVKTGDMKIDV
ncbi:MAG: PTS sugar transporter subunit IIC [Clostridia bacterium]|nr:PTS sugar transporter subunit IIC [Clostridia bacterium]